MLKRLISGCILCAAPAMLAARTVPAPTDFRLHALPDTTSPALHVDDPRSRLRTGFGGALVDLFPFDHGRFHLSAGKLYGRAGRPLVAGLVPERGRLLSGMRGRGGHRFAPAMLMGVGTTHENGLSLGMDAGVALGEVERMSGRLRMSRHDQGGGGRLNPVSRLTMLYRF